MNSSGGAILGLRQFDRAAVQMHLRPSARVLFTQPHPRMNGNDELWQVLRESSGNYRVKAVEFLTAQKPQATGPLFSLPAPAEQDWSSIFPLRIASR